MPKRLTTQEFISKAQAIHGNKYNYDKVNYINAHIKIKIYCNTCNSFFNQKPHNHLIGHNCIICSYILRQSIQSKSNKQFIKEAMLLHNNKYDYSQIQYVNTNTKIKIYCNICNHHFYQIPKNHLKGHGCPTCKSSKGELQIKQYLKKHNIDYEPQKSFPDCKNKRVLPFDFYLPKHNILIEYDGKQHHKAIKYFGGVNQLKYIQHNDRIKTEYCKQNNIQLIRIPYHNFENIESILNKSIF